MSKHPSEVDEWSLVIAFPYSEAYITEVVTLQQCSNESQWIKYHIMHSVILLSVEIYSYLVITVSVTLF